MRLMIELDHSLRNHKWMVIRQRYDTGSKHYSLSSFCRCGKKNLGRGNHFPPGRVVLTTPKFVKPQPIKMCHKFQIALKLQCWVFTDGVVGS
jgi:hypothetical protein